MKTPDHYKWAAMILLIMVPLAFGDGPADTPATTQADTPAVKIAAPDAASVNAQMKLARDIFKDDIAAASTPDQLNAVARKILKAARDEPTPAGKFALFTLARDTGASGGDMETACDAINGLDAAFQIDAVKMMVDAAELFNKTNHPPDACVAFVQQAGPFVDRAIAADRYDLAKRLGTIDVTSARATGDSDLLAQATTRLQQITDAQAAYTDAKAAETALQKTPTSPDANLKLGKYRCFVKGDWDTGLPMLALGSDAALKSMAAKDLNGATSASDQIAIGGAWSQLAEKQRGSVKNQMLSRAAAWYERASQQLAGMQKTRVDTLLAKIVDEQNDDPTSIIKGKATELFPAKMNNGHLEVQDGVCTVPSGRGMQTTDMYAPPIAFRAVLKMETKSSLGLVFGGGTVRFDGAGEGNRSEVRVWGGPADGRSLRGAGSLPSNQWVTIDEVLLPDSMTIYVNGKERFRTQADFSQTNQLFMLYFEGNMQFKSLLVGTPR